MTTTPVVFSDSGYVTVYTIDLPAAGDLTLTGTITTDGNLGTLTLADILDWDLTVYSASLSAGYEFLGPGHGYALNSTLTLNSDGGRSPLALTATATTLSLLSPSGVFDLETIPHGSVPSGQAVVTPSPPGVNVEYFTVDTAHGSDEVEIGIPFGIQLAHAGVQIPDPFISDVAKNGSLTTLSGMSEPDSTVTVFDGSKPLGTVTADGSGDWSLKANISSGVHQFTETATDLAGNTGSSAAVTDYAVGGNKTLTGGSGYDFLIAGKNDTLIGGAGNDTFVFNPGFGKETVADFNPNQDQLAFDHTLFTHDTAAQVLSQMHDTSAGAVLVADHHDTVTFTGVTVAQLQAAHIHFF